MQRPVKTQSTTTDPKLSLPDSGCSASVVSELLLSIFSHRAARRQGRQHQSVCPAPRRLRHNRKAARSGRLGETSVFLRGRMLLTLVISGPPPPGSLTFMKSWRTCVSHSLRKLPSEDKFYIGATHWGEFLRTIEAFCNVICLWLKVMKASVSSALVAVVSDLCYHLVFLSLIVWGSRIYSTCHFIFYLLPLDSHRISFVTFTFRRDWIWEWVRFSLLFISFIV